VPLERRDERLPYAVGASLSESFIVLGRSDWVRMPCKLHPTDFVGLLRKNTPRPTIDLCKLGWAEIRFVEGEANDVRGHHARGLR
jgi:hypothetical protein